MDEIFTIYLNPNGKWFEELMKIVNDLNIDISNIKYNKQER
jgi:hypothetical protein